MRIPRNALWLIPLFVIFTFPIWKQPLGAFLAPRGKYDPDFYNKEKVEHNFSMEKVNILQSKEGKITADIRANRALTSKMPNEYILKTIDADIIGENGQVTNISASDGVYNDITRRLKLVKNVVVTSKTDNYTLNTELLYYYNRTNKIHCPITTRFSGDGIFIRGSRFDYDINNGIYDVGGRVYCTIKDGANR